MGMERRTFGQKLATYITLACLLVIALFPLYWMLNTSLKTNGEIYSITPTFWPKQLTLSGYEKLFTEKKFLNNIKNSLIVALTVSIVSIVVSVFAGYAIAKLRFTGKRLVSNGILYAYLMPRAVMFIPLYILVTSLGIGNSIYGLMLIYPTITIPYATWMMISYFQSIPDEIEEAAAIDGCSRLRTLLQIVFPLSAPGIAATFIFAFTLCWSEYLYALVIITDSAMKPITLGLSDMIVGDVYAWGPLMGGSMVASVPVVVLYLLVSKYMVSGLTMGGVK